MSEAREQVCGVLEAPGTHWQVQEGRSRTKDQAGSPWKGL